MICLRHLSHEFIHDVPSVPGGKYPTTTSAWKNTGFPSCQVLYYNQQRSSPGEGRAFGKPGWQRELTRRSEARSINVASFPKYFYTFQMQLAFDINKVPVRA